LIRIENTNTNQYHLLSFKEQQRNQGAQVAGSRYVNSRLRIALGTFVAVEAETADPRQAQLALEAAFAAIDKVGRLMHPTRCGSDLLAIRDAREGRCVSVDPWTWEVLELAQRLHGLSDGVFDPCLPGYIGRLDALELSASHSVRRHAPLALDLGGIAKGFAVDCAITALRDAGCQAGLVNAGGDLRVFGGRVHYIACRGSTEHTAQVRLYDAALAVSGPRDPAAPAEHQGYYNRVAVLRARPRPVAVSAPTAAVADALTKCVMLGTSANSAQLLRRFDARQLRADSGLPVHERRRS
jgi:thiamine biosynthesis lipoprotein